MMRLWKRSSPVRLGANLERGNLLSSDLPVALYLNQRVAFDLLAVLEGGFAQLATVQQSSTNVVATSVGGEAGLGSSNPFAFLGITLGAKGSREVSGTLSGTTTKELVHTPTSLFARLRQEIHRRGLVRVLGEGDRGFGEVVPGEFVEFEATLGRSPLFEVLSAFRGVIRITEAFGDSAPSPAEPGRRGHAQQGKGLTETQQISRQIDALIEAVSAASSQDLVATCGFQRLVLTVEAPYFVDPSMNDIIDGTFRVFGKVTRVVGEGDDPISLLRKTELGKFGTVVEQLGGAFESLPMAGFTGQKVVTSIPAPTLQVIPIAIFA